MVKKPRRLVGKKFYSNLGDGPGGVIEGKVENQSGQYYFIPENSDKKFYFSVNGKKRISLEDGVLFQKQYTSRGRI